MTIRTMTIAASDVKPGDSIYNSHGYCESAKWERVIEIASQDGSPYPGTTNPRKYVVIKTRVFNTWKDPGEGVSVRRSVE